MKKFYVRVFLRVTNRYTYLICFLAVILCYLCIRNCTVSPQPLMPEFFSKIS